MPPKGTIPPFLFPAWQKKSAHSPSCGSPTAAQHIADADIHQKFLRRNGTQIYRISQQHHLPPDLPRTVQVVETAVATVQCHGAAGPRCAQVILRRDALFRMYQPLGQLYQPPVPQQLLHSPADKRSAPLWCASPRPFPARSSSPPDYPVPAPRGSASSVFSLFSNFLFSILLFLLWCFKFRGGFPALYLRLTRIHTLFGAVQISADCASSSLAYASRPASSSLPSSDFPSPKSPVEFLRAAEML